MQKKALRDNLRKKNNAPYFQWQTDLDCMQTGLIPALLCYEARLFHVQDVP